MLVFRSRPEPLWMYHFTILAGETQRSFVQFLQLGHACQTETIPGLNDMIAKFK